MIIFQATKYLIIDMCLEKFFHNIHKNITVPTLMGVNVDELVDTYFDDFMDFLYGEADSNLMIDSRIIDRFFQERVGMHLDKLVLDAVSEQFIEFIIDDNDPDDDDEDHPGDYGYV